MVTEQAGAPGNEPVAQDTPEAKVPKALIRIQYYRSAIAFPRTQKRIIKALGITKLNQVVERPDTPSMRGCVNKVPHLLRIVD